MHILLYQLALTLFFALMFTAGRLAFLFTFGSGFLDSGNTLRALLLGLRFDIALCALPCAVCAALWLYDHKKAAARLAALFGALCAFFIFAEFPFYRECGSRLNLMFFKYMAWPHQLLTQLAGTMSLRVVVPVLAVLWFAGKWSGEFARALPVREPKNRPAALAAVFGVALALAWGQPARMPLSPSQAFFCPVNVLNQAALNGPHNLAFKSAGKLLGDNFSKAPDARADALAISSFTGLCGAYDTPAIELTPGPRPNVVIVFMESVYSGHLEAGLMPNLSRRKAQGLYFSRYYSNVIGTLLGLSAGLSSYAPPPQDVYSAAGILAPTVAHYLGEAGYDSLFVYGKDGIFEDMEQFVRTNGFRNFYDYKSYPESDPAWREITDELLFEKAHDYFSQAKQPFIAAVLTSANHVPYHFPESFKESPKEPRISRAVRFTDYALERFLRLAEKSSYYKNTVFIITADHAPHYLTDFSAQSFNVPLLVLSPRLKAKGATDTRIASAVDLPRSILRLCGVDDTDTPFVGAGLEARAKYPAAYVSSVFYHGAVTPEGFFMRGNDEAQTPALPPAPGAAPLNFASAMFRTSVRIETAKDSRLLPEFLPACPPN